MHELKCLKSSGKIHIIMKLSYRWFGGVDSSAKYYNFTIFYNNISYVLGEARITCVKSLEDHQQSTHYYQLPLGF